MDVIRAWVISIAAVILIVVFLDILLPKGDIKKYINFVLGLVVMIIILRPMLNVFNNSHNFELSLMESSYNVDRNQLRSQVKDLEKANLNSTIQLYRAKLDQEIAGFIKKQGSFKEVSSNILVNEDITSEDFGKIIALDIFVQEGDGGEEPKQQVVQRIKSVSVIINNQQPQVEASKVKEDSQLYSNIKNSISSFYNIDEENISIYIQKNN